MSGEDDEAVEVVEAPVKYKRGYHPNAIAQLKQYRTPITPENAREMAARRVVKQNAQKAKVTELLQMLVLSDDRNHTRILLDVMRKHPFLSAYVGVLEHEDPRVRAEWAEKILDRILGKPKQQTELTGADSGPLWMQIQSVAVVSGPDPI